MNLSENEQAELRRILDSPLFKKAKEAVISEGEGPIYHLLAPEAGIALAQEKGIKSAFRLLDKITLPARTSKSISPKNNLKLTKH